MMPSTPPGQGQYVVEMRENFTVDGAYTQERPLHDAAGNMIYDGLYRFSYDAWGRQSKVERAYRDSSGGLCVGSTIAAMKYDGLGH